MNRSLRILLILLALALTGWRIHAVIAARKAKKTDRRPESVAVAVSPVERKTLQDVRVLTGTLIPRSQFILAPKVAGRLEKLGVHIGDTVRNGDVIAELDSQEHQQQVEQSRAELEVARAEVLDARSGLDAASNDYTRVNELLVQKVASESEADQARARFLAAQAREAVTAAKVRQAEAALRASEVRLSYTRIRAAWDEAGVVAVVGERFADEGAMLRANDPIVSILDMGSVLAVLTVIERDYPRLHPGQEAVVTTDAHPGRSFSGRILRKAPLLREESRQARVELEIPNAEGLLAPGMFIRAEIVLETKADVPTVPSAALVRRQDRAGVFEIENGKARFTPAGTGLVSGPDTELLPPAPAGPVVTLGQHLLQDGTDVRVTDAPAAGQDAPRP